MSSIYQKAIDQLSIYLEIPTAKESVTRAIRKLEKQEAEVRIENQLERDVAPEILQKLLKENEKKKLGEIEKIRIITHEFLLQQKFGTQEFVHLCDNKYSLKGYEDVVYVFELKFTSDCDVILKRLQYGNRQPKGAVYTFVEVPNLAIEERKKDERILRNNLKGLRVEFKRCWEHLNIDKTPSVSEETTTAEDVSDWLSSAS